MKRIFVIVLALMSMMLLVGCGNKDVVNSNNDSDKMLEEVAQTKTLAFFQKFVSGGAYTMEMSMEYDGEKIKTLNAYNGEEIYTESEYNGVKNCLIMKGGYQYVIDHLSKTCMKMKVLEKTTAEMFADEEENYKVAVATGKTEYNGKNYEYEEFTVNGEKVQYLFEGADLKVIKTITMEEEAIVEIIKFEKGVDKSLFEIPSGYTIIEY